MAHGLCMYVQCRDGASARMGKCYLLDPGFSKASRPTTTRQRCSAVDPHVEERGSCCSLQPALEPLSLGLSSWEGERILGIIGSHLGTRRLSYPNLRPRPRTVPLRLPCLLVYCPCARTASCKDLHQKGGHGNSSLRNFRATSRLSCPSNLLMAL
ncbi:hypothetical protein M431DRAFT_352796 [Trichoderma harzianum CBS 226.95]|uniref:Uncharacterized protein n=1 Tax=Trichoderma harzianum CBS 226.95 TaxID=983964 RepID=A0A2T4ALH2_TRIHA|nr:hypothetical protein M431DRAFT_352796 [Trichoderma harzianum CBS 226.95]PTB57913.1 hypothetical protein M431DRAFT_352796 [Trichoderma harzianum CBS 226.95]